MSTRPSLSALGLAFADCLRQDRNAALDFTEPGGGGGGGVICLARSADIKGLRDIGDAETTH